MHTVNRRYRVGVAGMGRPRPWDLLGTEDGTGRRYESQMKRRGQTEEGCG